MKGLTDNLEPIVDQIRQSFSAIDAVREKVLPLCREVIRHSSKAIRAIHRQEFERTQELLQSARTVLDQAQQAAGDYSEIATAKYIKDAQKEFAGDDGDGGSAPTRLVSAE